MKESFVLKKGKGTHTGMSWWTICHDFENGRYTAEYYFNNGCVGAYYLYEITEETYNKINELEDDEQSERLICSGRPLYEDHSDINAVNYHIIYDSNYEKICHWAHIITSDTDVPTWVD